MLTALLVFVLPVGAEEINPSDKVIQVTGFGESETTPDIATFSLGVHTENTDAALAQQENAKNIEKVITALKNAGIPNSDISTEGYSMYSYVVSEENEGTYPKGTTVYSVTNTATVKTSSINEVGTYIDAAVNAGANVVNQIRFSLSNEKYLQQRNLALSSAVKAARSDAEAVAGSLGVSLKECGKIVVDQSYQPVSYATTGVANSGSGAVPRMKDAVLESGTEIQSGTLKTTATVSITYLY